MFITPVSPTKHLIYENAFIFSVHKIEQSVGEVDRRRYILSVQTLGISTHKIAHTPCVTISIVNLISPSSVRDNDNYCCKIGDINPLFIIDYQLIIDFALVLLVI